MAITNEMKQCLYDGERIDEVNDDLVLIQKPSGLTFGTDALLLAGFIPPIKNGYFLELGGGSGIISMLLLARGKCQRALCVEVQEEYADLCIRNALINGLDTRLSSLCADVRDLAALAPAERFDTVFSNPPYLPCGAGPENEHAPKTIARREIMGGIRDFCRAASYALKYGGSFYCVYRSERLADLFSAMKEFSLEPKKLIPIMTDTESAPTLILAEGRKGGKSGLIYDKPLYLYRTGTRDYTDEMNALMDSGQLIR